MGPRTFTLATLYFLTPGPINHAEVKCHIMHISFLKNQPEFPKFTLNGEEINTADKMKLLGVTIQSNLSWDIQTNHMISRASRRMYMLYVLKRLRASVADLTAVYQMYIRTVLEYASPLWHRSITKHQIDDIELIQKRACLIILGSHYKSYAEALKTLELCSLVERREKLLRGFGEQLLKSERHTTMLPAPKRNGMAETSELLINLIRLNAEQLAAGSIPCQLLLTILIISYSLC